MQVKYYLWGITSFVKAYQSWSCHHALPNPVDKENNKNFKLIVSICCVIAFLLLSSLVAIYLGRKRNKKFSSSSPIMDMISRVSYQSLHDTTDGFSITKLIESGSFGSIYKGSFESQEVVATKVINLQIRELSRVLLLNVMHLEMQSIKIW